MKWGLALLPAPTTPLRSLDCPLRGFRAKRCLRIRPMARGCHGLTDWFLILPASASACALALPDWSSTAPFCQFSFPSAVPESNSFSPLNQLSSTLDFFGFPVPSSASTLEKSHIDMSRASGICTRLPVDNGDIGGRIRCYSPPPFSGHIRP